MLGLGMGSGFGTIYDIALGNIDPDEAGSASGALSAVRQLAASVGSAAITSIWFSGAATRAASSMTTCLAVVAVVTAGCCTLVWILPRTAPQEAAH